MKLLAWNCRGLLSSRAVRALLEVRNRLNPDVFFLSETHLDNEKANNLRRRAGFDKMLVHESDGRSGGLLLLWKEEINIRMQDITKYYIDVIIEDDGGGDLLVFMGNRIGARKEEHGKLSDQLSKICRHHG
jgi:exonuclease III